MFQSHLRRLVSPAIKPAIYESGALAGHSFCLLRCLVWTEADSLAEPTREASHDSEVRKLFSPARYASVLTLFLDTCRLGRRCTVPQNSRLSMPDME